MFMSDISIIVRRMRTLSERAMNRMNVGFPEQLVLMFLRAHGASNQEAISSQLGIDKGAVAKTIAKLESKGLVKRETDQANKRQKIVEATPAAETIFAAMQSVWAETERTLFKGFTPQERQQACDYLARIAQNVSEGNKE